MRISKMVGGLGVIVMMGFGALAGGCANEAVGEPEPAVRNDRSQNKKDTPSSSSNNNGSNNNGSSGAPTAPTAPPSSPTTPTDPPRGEDPPTEPTPPTTPTMVVSNVGFQASSRCIDAPGGNMDPGVTLVAWPCHLAGNQRFSLHSNGMLKAQNGNCVDLPGGKDHPILWMCHSGVVGENQRWTYDGKTLRSMSKCLAVRGDTVVMETCNGSSAQKWTTLSE